MYVYVYLYDKFLQVTPKNVHVHMQHKINIFNDSILILEAGDKSEAFA